MNPLPLGPIALFTAGKLLFVVGLHGLKARRPIVFSGHWSWLFVVLILSFVAGAYPSVAAIPVWELALVAAVLILSVAGRRWTCGGTVLGLRLDVLRPQLELSAAALTSAPAADPRGVSGPRDGTKLHVVSTWPGICGFSLHPPNESLAAGLRRALRATWAEREYQADPRPFHALRNLGLSLEAVALGVWMLQVVAR